MSSTLYSHIQSLGMSSADLSSQVVLEANRLATESSDKGLETQLKFLLETCGLSEEDVLASIFSTFHLIGTTIEIGPPRHGDSGYSEPFSGIVVEVGKKLKVIASGDEFIEVYYDEIFSFTKGLCLSS